MSRSDSDRSYHQYLSPKHAPSTGWDPHSRPADQEQHTVRLIPKEENPASSARESRDDIIQEFIETEEAFLTNAQTCVTNFVLPIRAQDRRSWIGGVPTNISLLLDWYEDIVNLHLSIYQALESSASAQNRYSVMSGLPSYLRDFIPRLHVYQPYLARLADVLEEILRLASDKNSEFGEFIRMQERALHNSGWTFERLLTEPVHRLAAYQELFSVRS